MENFSIIDCDNNFYEIVEDLINNENIKEKIEELERIYTMLSERFQGVLCTLWSDDKDYIDVNEFKDFIRTRYGYSNFDSFFNMIEDFEKFYQKEKDWENIEF